MILILDSSVLIAFYEELEEPGLLHLFGERWKISIPKAVLEEIKAGKTVKKLRRYLNNEIELVSEINTDEIEMMKNRYPYLGNGEIEVILHGLHFKAEEEDYLCVIDDKKARKVAERLGINFCGTIGLCMKLRDLRFISEEKLESVVNKLTSSGFRFKKQ